MSNNSHNNKSSYNPNNSSQGYSIISELSNTLQGFLYLAFDHKRQEKVAIKQYFKHCIINGITKQGTKVRENFEKEFKNQLYLSNLPNSHKFNGFLRLRDRMSDCNSEYLVFDLCKRELFDVIKAFHSHNIPRTQGKEYRSLVQRVFRSLVDTVSYFHRNGVAHLDLSLENVMISDDLMLNNINLKNTSNINVQIIDFGTSQYFPKYDFKYTGLIGKNKYMAPEVFAGLRFDARKADIWSLGIILFLMLMGGEPFSEQKRISETPALKLMLNGKLSDLLKLYNTLDLIDESCLDLLNQIFKLEKDRININQLRNHPWVKLGNQPKPEHLLINASKVETSVLNKVEMPKPQKNVKNVEDIICAKVSITKPVIASVNIIDRNKNIPKSSIVVTNN